METAAGTATRRGGERPREAGPPPVGARAAAPRYKAGDSSSDRIHAVAP